MVQEGPTGIARLFGLRLCRAMPFVVNLITNRSVFSVFRVFNGSQELGSGYAGLGAMRAGWYPLQFGDILAR